MNPFSEEKGLKGRLAETINGDWEPLRQSLSLETWTVQRTPEDPQVPERDTGVDGIGRLLSDLHLSGVTSQSESPRSRPGPPVPGEC